MNMEDTTTTTASEPTTDTTTVQTPSQTTEQTSTENNAGALDVQENAGKGESQSDNGALSQVNQEEGKTEEVVDYSKMTDDEYTAKLEKIEGLNTEEFAKTYGKFCRDEKISPEVVSKYLKMEKSMLDEQQKETQAQQAKEMKAFQEEGVQLRKEFNPQQIQSAIKGLHSIGADEKFMKYATKELSNNKTLVKLLMNWNETHSEDGTPGVGGSAQSQEKTFEQVWTGK